MISTTTINGKPVYDLVELVLDTEEDIPNLKKTYAPGSTAFVISTGDCYMLNSKLEWVQI